MLQKAMTKKIYAQFAIAIFKQQKK